MPRENGRVSNLHKIEKGGVPRITLRRFPKWREGAPSPAGDDMRPNLVGLGGGTKIP